LIKFYSVFSEPFPFQQTVLVYAQLMSQGSANPVPERITIKGNCVECGCPLGAEPAPFEGSKSKPLAPGILHFKSNYRTRHSTSVWHVVNHADSSTGKNGRHDADNCPGSSHWRQLALPMPYGCCGNYLNSNQHFLNDIGITVLKRDHVLSTNQLQTTTKPAAIPFSQLMLIFLCLQ